MLSLTFDSVALNPRATATGTVLLIAEKLAMIYKEENPQFHMPNWRAAVGYDNPGNMTAIRCSGCTAGLPLVNGKHRSASGSFIMDCDNFNHPRVR